MNRSRLNIVLLVLYVLGALGVLVYALISPSFRQQAYAPLRELLIPPPEPVMVDLLYSTEKEAWLEEMIPAFYATNPRVDGRPVQIAVEKSGSREMVLAVLNEGRQPTLLSPASSLQSAILEDLSQARFGRTLVRANDPASCRPVVNSPVVLVAWEERASVLWGQNPGAQVWSDLHDAVTNPEGWAAYGHPEWGFVKFGHTDPLRSNSGFQALLLMTYDYHGKSSGMNSADILSDSGYQDWLVELESTIGDFGSSTGTYMEDMVAYGPSVYDIVAVYEATAIGSAAQAEGRYGPLRIYYPPATHYSDHPFCLLDGEWVTPEQREAATLFIEFLLSQPAQENALVNHGFRPANNAVDLQMPGSPFAGGSIRGLRVDLPPEVETPDGEVLNTLLDFWSRNVGG